MMEFLAPILTAVAAVIGSIGLYLKTKAGTDVTYAEGWERIASNLEIRIKKLEDLMERKDHEHAKEIAEKNARISILEDRVALLEKELEKQLMLNTERVEAVKTTLHAEVETNLENLKT